MATTNRTCSIDGCAKPAISRGWCPMHYRRWNLYGNPEEPSHSEHAKLCGVAKCGKSHLSKGLCSKHYARMRKHGDENYEPIVIERGMCEVPTCIEPIVARGWCQRHWARWKRTGNPEGSTRIQTEQCTVSGCTYTGTHRGVCGKHYQRLARHGSPFATSRIVGADAARFWMYTMDETKAECWEWIGAKSADGYGTLRIDGTTAYMPRFAYELLIGPVGVGLEPDHLCRNRGCVNPWHLEPVTHRENILRGESPQAINARKTHCIRGHKFTPENTRRDNSGGRSCRACQKMRDSNRRQSA